MGKELQEELEKQIQLAMEEERLKDTIEIINDEILKCIEKRKDITKMILEYRKNILDEYKDDEDKIIEYFDHESYIKEESFKITDRKLKELTILKNSPYFGKVTFREEDYGIEDIYIGRFGVTLEDSFEPLIVDWRAPIAAIFYNGTAERAHYNAPDGKVEVSLLGRVQYIIKKGKLEGLFNSSVDVKDDILQMVLSKNSSEKLKDIIMTIQKEQDEIIRQDRNRTIVVDGVAGSGKTTIALHRVAYLIYNYRKLLENKVLILGPNRIFIDYISNVLPTLGETGVFQSTFLDLALELTTVDEVIDMKEAMERILSGDDKFHKDILYKKSMKYQRDLDSLVEKLEAEAYKPKDLLYNNKIIVEALTIEKMFKEDFSTMPLFRRAKKIKRILFSKLKDARDEAFRNLEAEIAKEKEAIPKEDLIFHINDIEFRRKLRLREIIKAVILAKESLSYLDEKCIEEIYNSFNGEKDLTEEDLVGILYLKIKLQGLKVKGEIKHVVVDEAQDYSLLQFEVLRSLTNTKSMTIVGDSNQQMIKGLEGSSLWDLKNKYEEEVELVRLNRSYRSTKEIMEYSNKYIKDTTIVPMVRTGESVKNLRASDNEDLKNKILAQVEELKQGGLENIALITRNLKEAKEVYQLINSEVFVKLMEKENSHISEGVMVMPSYYAKGLEFDGAIIITEEEEEKAIDKLMYIMCTRALHRLVVINK